MLRTPVLPGDEVCLMSCEKIQTQEERPVGSFGLVS